MDHRRRGRWKAMEGKRRADLFLETGAVMQASRSLSRLLIILVVPQAQRQSNTSMSFYSFNMTQPLSEVNLHPPNEIRNSELDKFIDQVLWYYCSELFNSAGGVTCDTLCRNGPTGRFTSNL